MGITGLLQFLKSSIKPKHIKNYANSTIGIDGHAWIHTVLPAIASDLYYGKPTDKHISLFMSKVKNLQEYGIKPLFVFDGDFLPSKEKTFIERKEAKEKARKEVESCIKRNDMVRARELMKRCVSVTPAILNSIIQILRINNIEYIISPYESDAQLYYLQRSGYIEYILTEDSDLIIYGCTKILYKLSGNRVEEFDSKLLPSCKDQFFAKNILDICILSGCDYLNSIRGVGLITAHKKLKESGGVKEFLQHMIMINKEVPENYYELFMNAKYTFLHHIVYDPISKSRIYLQDPITHYHFLGDINHAPFIFENITIDRHFKPELKEIIQECDISPFVLDSVITSSYFDS